MKKILFCMAMISVPTSPAFSDPLDVFATYKTQNGASHIQVFDCGDGTPCGKVVWIDAATLKAGLTPETAIGRNGQQILGLTLLKNFQTYAGSGEWRGGTVYDPENDKVYAARIKRLEDGNLQLKGCVGPFCQTQVWSEVSNKIAANQFPTQ